MVATYTIAGRVIPSHHLALGTLALVALLAVPKPWKATPKKEVKIEASSPEEEKFIEKYLLDHQAKQ
ncbi:DEKNAAC103036 [Brettanomyces naardenensis]|uniref:DEKNAAC103036 n=1 Tax=Brettanomyces naardenensis TaxID=13370 RepID=A0A448YMB8_BRENA|nr:DEKNAAC103036 [Brettanomyces naardenensis]